MPENIRKPGRKVMVDIEERRAESNSTNVRPRRRRLNEPGKQNEPAPEVSTTFNDIAKAYGAEAIGMVIGGLFGGTEGALSGAQFGAAAGKTLNTITDQRQKRSDERSDKEFTQDIQEIQIEQATEKQRAAIEQDVLKQQLDTQKFLAEQGEVKEGKEVHVPTGQVVLTNKAGQKFINDPSTGELVNVSGQTKSQGFLNTLTTRRGQDLLQTRHGQDFDQRERKINIELAKLKGEDRKDFINKYDNEVKPLRGAIENIGKARAALNDPTNLAAPRLTASAVIRAIETSGVISDKDIESVKGKRDVVTGLKRLVEQQLGTGIPFTGDDRKDMAIVIDSLEKITLQDIERRRGRLARTFGLASVVSSPQELEAISRPSNEFDDLLGE